MRLRFDHDCSIDTDRRELSRGDRDLSLSPKAYDLLILLLDARPKAMTKAQLCRALWPRTFVVPANLANLIAEIRTVLGDDAHHPRIIRTLHRFGYAFVAHADVVPATLAHHWLRWKTTDLPLYAGENIVGRAGDAHICLDVPGVSRCHARVMVEGDTVTLEDLASKNGTFVDGHRITTPRVLAPGDRVTFGQATVTLRAASSESSTTTLPSGR